jgi:hypothetical protein
VRRSASLPSALIRASPFLHPAVPRHTNCIRRIVIPYSLCTPSKCLLDCRG